MNKSWLWITNLMLFLFGMNFYQQAALIGSIIFLYCLYKLNHRVECNVNFALLCVGVLTYFVMYIIHYDVPPLSQLFSRMIGPVALYLAGACVAKQGIQELWKSIYYIALGNAVHGIGNVIINWGVNLVDVHGRAYLDIWYGSMAATGQNLLFVMIAACLFYFLYCEKSQLQRCIGLVGIVIAMIGTITSGSRTLIYVVLACYIVSLIVYLLITSRNQIRKPINPLFGTGLLLLIIIGSFSFNVMGISEWFNNSGLVTRFDGNTETMWTETGRFDLSIRALSLLMNHPMGNIEMDSFAHNFWIDIAIEVGIIPALFHLLFCIISLKTIWKLKRMYPQYHIAIFATAVAITMVMFTEPILIGYPYLYMAFCFISGGVRCVVDQAQLSRR